MLIKRTSIYPSHYWKKRVKILDILTVCIDCYDTNNESYWTMAPKQEWATRNDKTLLAWCIFLTILYITTLNNKKQKRNRNQSSNDQLIFNQIIFSYLLIISSLSFSFFSFIWSGSRCNEEHERDWLLQSFIIKIITLIHNCMMLYNIYNKISGK